MCSIKLRDVVTITKYNDAGHGWAKVKRSILKELGILDKITSSSYERGDYVYLEEDLDLSTYINKLKEIKPNVKFKWREFNSDHSRIRSYEHFNNIDEKERELIEAKRKQLLSLNFCKKSKSIIKRVSVERINSLFKEYF